MLFWAYTFCRMSMRRRFRKTRSGVSHAGPHNHNSSHEHNPHCSYRCEGSVLEVSDGWFTVMVQKAHGRAKRWLGQQVPFSLEGAEIHDLTGSALGQIRPGDRIEIRTRLARRHNKEEEFIPVHRIHVLEAAQRDGARLAQEFAQRRSA